MHESLRDDEGMFGSDTVAGVAAMVSNDHWEIIKSDRSLRDPVGNHNSLICMRFTQWVRYWGEGGGWERRSK